MEILAHRGWWKAEEEKNTPTAFIRAMSAGVGLELDVRDQDGEIMIAHDAPLKDGTYVPFSDFLILWREYGRPKLAVNIKSDGLSLLLKDLFNAEDSASYFCFDMSVPETLQYLKNDLVIADRLSEYERGTFDSENIWLDSFHSDWWIEALSPEEESKAIFFVSPELHRRPYKPVWDYIKSNNSFSGICTDHVEEALGFFRE
jgi:glycerophosphoryl diester phosphodiesterase